MHSNAFGFLSANLAPFFGYIIVSINFFTAHFSYQKMSKLVLCSIFQE
jgi:hypothetical protein